jgi:hypothetical protein
MQERHKRANKNLGHLTVRTNLVLRSVKTQLKDASDALTDAMSDGYSAEKAIADAAALWINGAAIVGALYGLEPPEPCDDDSEGGEPSKG